MYLAFDTSNYKSSAACFDADTLTAYYKGKLLSVEQGSLGLRQSDAVFAHTKQMPSIVSDLLSEVPKSEILAVGASTRPRSVDGSYMPCFLVGEGLARSISSVNRVPFYPFSHQQGHLTAAAFSANKLSLLKSDFLAWHLSGGTTELLLVTPSDDEIISERIVMKTTDISAGQLIDRTGVMLGLPFPAGPMLSKLAQPAFDLVRPFKVKVSAEGFSLSGIENKVHKMYEEHTPSETICAFVLKTVLYAVCEATRVAKLLYPDIPLLCSGGVMSNEKITSCMNREFGAYFAKPDLSSDNALGIAILTAVKDGADFWNRI